VYKFITSVNELYIIGLYVAGVVVVSVEGYDVSESLGHSESLCHSESWDILSPVRHSLSVRRYSRIAAEKWGTAVVYTTWCKFLMHYAVNTDSTCW
jgi:hypothetical protein